jgi:hypothetical protein
MPHLTVKKNFRRPLPTVVLLLTTAASRVYTFQLVCSVPVTMMAPEQIFCMTILWYMGRTRTYFQFANVMLGQIPTWPSWQSCFDFPLHFQLVMVSISATTNELLSPPPQPPAGSGLEDIKPRSPWSKSPDLSSFFLCLYSCAHCRGFWH